MKKLFVSLFTSTTLLLAASSISAVEESSEKNQEMVVRQQPYCPSSCEELEFVEEPPCEFPGHISAVGGYTYVSPADFRSSPVRGEEISYKEGYVNLAYTHDLSTYHGFSLGLGYVNSNIGWAENPFFDQHDFGYVTANVGGFLKCPECWYWKATIGACFDTRKFSPASYTLYQGMLWGRYAVCEPLGLNFGFLAEVGLNKEKVWPILGIDYVINPEWKLNVIYPLDISLEYLFHPYWATGVSAKFLRSRHRVSDNEIEPKLIYEYRNTGFEWDIIFRPFGWISAEAFVGYTVGGDFKITNRYNHHAQHFKFDPSFYSGINAIINF